MSEMKNDWFKKFNAALKDSAPVLLQKMKRECAQPPPRAAFFDGHLAWDFVQALAAPAHRLPLESFADDEIVHTMTKKPPRA